jgi:SAM-dependent methyltransferase
MKGLLKTALNTLPQRWRWALYYRRAGYPSVASLSRLPAKRDLQHLYMLQSICPVRHPLAYDESSLLNRAHLNWCDVLVAIRPRRPEGCNLLEIGCGEGAFVQKALDCGANAYGVDIAGPRLERASSALRRRLRIGDAADLPFADDSYDVVVSLAAIEHYMDVAAFFSEVRRVLKPHGILYVSSGGLWNSPWGAHLYNHLFVPWAHLIYDYTVICDWYANAGGVAAIYPPEQVPASRRDLPYGGMNQVALAQYKEMIGSSGLTVIKERWKATALGTFLGAFPDVVRKYGFDELVTESCELVFVKSKLNLA